MHAFEPEPLGKNPTQSELKRYHRELREYEKRLKRWEKILSDHEAFLFELEEEIMKVEEDDCCDCEGDCEGDDEFVPVGLNKLSLDQNIIGGLRRSAVLEVPSDEVNFLEKLYSLSDDRRPRRK